jgi:outer membrane immunogenic protein
VKKITLAFGLASAWCALRFAGPEALAAGKEVEPQPIPPPPCFDGWYVGIHGAGIFESADNHVISQGQLSEHLPTLTSFNGVVRDSGGDNWGGAGGIHFGRNFQRGSFVFGLEADFSGGRLENDGGRAVLDVRDTLDNDASLTVDTTTKTTLNWYATVRPRLGYVFAQRLMTFVTGGLAVGQADFDVHTGIDVGLETDISSPVTGSKEVRTAGDEDPRLGWTVGGGIDFCLGPHVILNLMYLYVDLGEVNDVATGIATPLRGSDETFDFARGRASSDVKYHLFQGGVTFKF